jgi:hypothetical protein
MLVIVPCFAHQYRLGVRLGVKVRFKDRVRVCIYVDGCDWCAKHGTITKISTFNNDIFSGNFLSVEIFLECKWASRVNQICDARAHATMLVGLGRVMSIQWVN